jgi:hypothetical protein
MANVWNCCRNLSGLPGICHNAKPVSHNQGQSQERDYCDYQKKTDFDNDHGVILVKLKSWDYNQAKKNTPSS